MFLKAYDELFEKFDKKILSKIYGISASGQQHGSVYWKSGSLEQLSNLDGSKTHNVILVMVSKVVKVHRISFCKIFENLSNFNK